LTLFAPASAGSASGSVFRYSLSGTLTTLAVFNDPNVGAFPKAPLVEGNDGELYGTMSFHGNTGSFIYRVSKKGIVTPLAGTPPG
ncbi:choice-of-anchor tandem repeat GloVer-containing protein, partial [Acinetobacter baumannii]